MKILLTGASGFIGGHLRAALEAQNHVVIACSRSTGFDFNQLQTPQAWLDHVKEVDAVINAVGIISETKNQSFEVLHQQAPIALFQACEQANVKQAIQVSALGADKDAFTPYQLSKKAADDVLRTLSVASVILRPSLVYGEGGASMAMFRRLASLPIIPLVGDGQYKVQPVHISDVVATVLACLEKMPEQNTLDVVGPEAMTFINWLQAIRHSQGKSKAKTLASPFSLMLLVARFGQYVFPLLSPDNLRMLKAGNTANVGPLEQCLGRSPISPEQGLK